MKINKLLIILSLAIATVFVSCEEYEDTVTPGPTSSVTPNQVFFDAQ